MGECTWQDASGTPCGQRAHGEGDLCLWHNPRVRKTDAYIIPLLEQELLLRSGNIAGFQLQSLNWPNAEIPGGILREVDLSDGILPNADFSGADLSNADLSRCHLSGANFEGACLRGANLSNTHLGNANLRGCDLQGAIFDGTILLNANLRGANLNGASLKHFQWNRLTRFKDVQGLEPPQSGGRGDTSNELTVPFPSELAANDDIDVPTGSWNSLSGFETGMDHPRVYNEETNNRGSSEALSALTPDTSEAVTQPFVQPPPQPASANSVIQKPPKQWIFITMIATTWAVIASVIGLWAVLQPAPTGQTIVDRPLEINPSPPENQVIDLRKIQQSENTIKALQQEIAELRRTNDRQQQFLSQARVEKVNLLNAADENVGLREEVRLLEREIAQLAYNNRRLEETASILAKGNRTLSARNQQLTHENNERFAKIEEVTRFEAERDRAREDLEKTEIELASTRSERDQLRRDLELSNANIERFLTRIEGTRLEGIMQGAGNRNPIVRVTPGEAISMGGDNLLISMRIEPSDKPGRIRVNTVVQRSDNDLLPDISVVLYDAEGEALRRLSFSFPAKNSRMPFATAITEIDSPSFPSGARISAAQGLDNNLLSAK